MSMLVIPGQAMVCCGCEGVIEVAPGSEKEKGTDILKCRIHWSFVTLFVLIQILSMQHTRAANKLRGFPVKLKDTVDVGSVLTFDIDDDGQLEIVIGTRNKLHAVEQDGHVVNGFPLVWGPGIQLATALTAGRWGIEKEPAVFFGTEDGRLVALKRDGTAWDGFPLILRSAAVEAPTLADVDGDGRDEIVVGTKDGSIHVIREGGSHMAGYPASVSAPITSVVTLGRFQPRGPHALFFGDARGNLHAWSAPGREIDGFPYKARYSVSGQPVFGDIDDDGRFEVIFGSKDYGVYAVRENGKAVDGFPLITGYRIYSTCALADVDGDGVTDIVAASGDGKVYAVAGRGNVLPGFPVHAGGRLRASPIIGDVDGDGRMEIAIGTDRNQLLVYRNNGTVYPGFPVSTGDKIEVTPALADLNGDGLIELIGVSRNGVLSAVSMIKKGKVRNQLAWPLEGRNVNRSGVTFPNPPRYIGISLSPNNPDTTTGVRLDYRFFDLDGEPEPKTMIKWFRNGKHVRKLDQSRRLAASKTQKHEVWHVTLRADPKHTVFSSPSVKIINTPPESPKVSFLPVGPKTKDNLSMKIISKSNDVDKDRVKYDIVWIKDQEPQKNLSGSVVASKYTASGEYWTVVVTPHDGEISGLPARVSQTVLNTAPLAPKIRLDPSKATVTQDIKVVIEKEAEDADKDQVSYLYDWKIDGEPLNLGRGKGAVPAGLVAKHSKLTVNVTSFDGHQEGGSSLSSTKIINSTPAAPVVKIFPSSPRTGDVLTVEIKKPAADPDHDLIDYRVKWKRVAPKGKNQTVANLRLPVGKTRKGETWMVEVIPHDGESAGKPVSARVTIDNTKPDPPQVHAHNPRPTTSEDIMLVVDKPAQDLDGDRVSVGVIWYEEGKEVMRGENAFRLSSSKTAKSRRYMAKLVPYDGTDSGAEVVQWFEVQNTAPSGCQVVIEPKDPRSGSQLHAVVTKKPIDPDGDPIQMRLRWYCNNVRFESHNRPFWIEANQVKRDQRWTVLATAFDGEAYGPSCEGSIVVGNSPPSKPIIVLEPPNPTTLNALSAVTKTPSVDPDGDKLTLQYSWTLNGRAFPVSDNTQVISAGLMNKGQRWGVAVVASDGELKSKVVEKYARVINSLPEIPKVNIEPVSPTSDQDLYCRLSGPTIDPDGDSIRHSYAWYLSEEAGDRKSNQSVHLGVKLPAHKTRKGQNWICRITAHDKDSKGGVGSGQVRIENSPPTMPQVEIRPDGPRGLQCVVIQPSIDPDGDKVEYRYRWFKDGVLQSWSPQISRVDGKLTGKDDIWRCAVSATDGRLESVQVQTQDILVVEVKGQKK